MTKVNLNRTKMQAKIEKNYGYEIITDFFIIF